jgi:hypothetical protein
MSANPDDKDKPDPRQQFRDRLNDIKNQRNYAISAIGVLGGLAVILITQSQDTLGPTAVFTYGIALGLAAFNMITNVGALNGHKISAEIGLAVAEQIVEQAAEIKAEIAELREMLLTAVDAAAKDEGDEVARRRDSR